MLPKSRALSLALGLTLLWVGTIHAALQPEAVGILEGMFHAYATAAAFSCEGTCDDHQDGSSLPPDHRTVTINFARPDRFRLTWTQKNFGTQSGTSMIFVRDGKVLFRQWEAVEDQPEPSLGQAINGCAGISLGLSYLVPAMLLGDPGYLHFTALRRLANARSADGFTCYKLEGKTTEGARWELLIDRDNHALREAVEVNTLVAARHKHTQPIRTRYHFTQIQFATTLPDSAFVESGAGTETSER